MDTVKHSVDQPFLSLYPRGATYTSSTRVADCTTTEANKTIQTTDAEPLRLHSALWPGVSTWERPKMKRTFLRSIGITDGDER
nr:hypothetical protein BgiMline_006907 [Biomphalaria glabrata]